MFGPGMFQSMYMPFGAEHSSSLRFALASLPQKQRILPLCAPYY